MSGMGVSGACTSIPEADGPWYTAGMAIPCAGVVRMRFVPARMGPLLAYVGRSDRPFLAHRCSPCAVALSMCCSALRVLYRSPCAVALTWQTTAVLG